MMNGGLSIIIVTFGRPELLKACLASLNEAVKAVVNSCPVEIFLGLNGKDPSTERVLDADMSGLDSITPVVTKLPSAVSPAELRNRLLSSAKGEWVYFIDDDARVERDFFFKFLEVIGESPRSDVIGGPNLSPKDSNTFQTATGHVLSSRLATYFSTARYRPAGTTRPCGEEALILCNLFIRRSALETEKFPPEFVCCEESWLLQNLEHKGSRLVYAPELWVWHERRPTPRKLFSQVIRYGYGRGQILRRRPEGVRAAHVLPSLCVVYALVTLPVMALAPREVAWLVWPFAAYFVICFASATRLSIRERPAAAVGAWSFLLFPIIHTGYGIGLVMGLAKG